jgi:hypothetical protein
VPVPPAAARADHVGRTPLMRGAEAALPLVGRQPPAAGPVGLAPERHGEGVVAERRSDELPARRSADAVPAALPGAPALFRSSLAREVALLTRQVTEQVTTLIEARLEPSAPTPQRRAEPLPPKPLERDELYRLALREQRERDYRMGH